MTEKIIKFESETLSGIIVLLAVALFVWPGIYRYDYKTIEPYSINAKENSTTTRQMVVDDQIKLDRLTQKLYRYDRDLNKWVLWQEKQNTVNITISD